MTHQFSGTNHNSNGRNPDPATTEIQITSSENGGILRCTLRNLTKAASEPPPRHDVTVTHRPPEISIAPDPARDHVPCSSAIAEDSHGRNPITPIGASFASRFRKATIVKLSGKTALLAAGSLLIGLGTASAAQPDLSTMTMAQKTAAQAYFRAHSFDFSPTFSRYHPGPYWILHHEAAFKLTAAQKAKETSLKNGMAKATIKDDMILKSAYERYQADARKDHPSLAVIRHDIDRIGHAQTNLAVEMVPYHLKSYAVLNTTQKQTYKALAAEQTPPTPAPAN